MSRESKEDIVRHIRRSVGSASGQNPIVQTGNIGDDGQISIGLRTSLLNEEMALIKEHANLNILEVVGHDAEYFRQHPKSEEQLELILYVKDQ